MLLSPSPLKGLAKRLVDDKYIDPAHMQGLIQEAEHAQQPLTHWLSHKKIIPSRVLAHAIACDNGLPLFDLHSFKRALLPKQHFHPKLIRQYVALPLYQRSNDLYIAIADGQVTEALQAFAFHSGLRCRAIIVEQTQLTTLIDKVLHHQSEKRLAHIASDTHDLSEPDAIHYKPTDAEEDGPLIHFINQLIADAIKRGVSDIHFEPYASSYRIRFRHDGILYQAATPPMAIASRITARIKIMAKLDISEKRLPQDGHFVMTIEADQSIHCRISTCPTTAGEKIVLRILDPGKWMLSLNTLGLSQAQYATLSRVLTCTQGMILVVGPTGSGKTMSLYSALRVLNQEARNIMTVEDPVEIDITGINQVSVNTRAGLNFSQVLRAFLRQDPDVIMVGEIRDLETADIAMKAAQTGHLVLSTLHTYSAPGTISRLMNMGIAPYHIASSIKLIMAQRLARRLCMHCKRIETLSWDERIRFGLTSQEATTTLYQENPSGCHHCQFGFHGQMGLYEMLEMDEPLSLAIQEAAPLHRLHMLAENAGMKSLKQAGISHILAGLTSINEVLRITKD